ncbi:MAG: hypothetical protein H0T92_03475 [Pyrinomonadaceae bacterium]|nr:hypothetical protein [Pyrinomonadaceae bacterium]
MKAESDFGRLIERLSEPGGYFDSDNLVSNEASYLHVLGTMKKRNVTGGAYIGVGPEQSFSYIAQVRPRIAFIVDIRRDNLLHHLLFKSLFSIARNRIEYLCLLFGKPFPEDSKQWKQRSVQQLVEYLEKTPSRRETLEATSAEIQTKVKSFGVSLTAAELETINRVHTQFFNGGLDLRFTSRNRPSRSYYPTYRDLLLEKDLTGRQANYLANEDDFQFIKSLEKKNLIIPVVGDLAGEHALVAIGRLLTERNERLSTFYASNVEFYLMRDGSFDRFAQNLRGLPRNEQSVIIRSLFSGTYGYAHPQSVPGYFSTQILQTIDSLIKEHAGGGYQTYSDLVSKHSLDLR